MSPIIEARFFLHYATSDTTTFRLDVDLQFPGYGVTTFFGESGSGKTSLLRCIAGLQKAQQGYLNMTGEIWQDEKTFLPTHKRSLGYVFQEASLFSHLTVSENLDYAIKRAFGKGHLISRNDALDLLGISHLLDRYPNQISGGERQRAAIARALLINPKLLLMDEPLASLDLARKQEILPYLEMLKKTLKIPILYVSHAPDEVARLSDHLVIIKDGQIKASGPLQETLSHLDLPLRPGEDIGVVLETKIIAKDPTWHLAQATFKDGDFWITDHDHLIGASLRLRILARDVSLTLSPHQDSSILNVFEGVIVNIALDAHQAMSLVQIAVGESKLLARVTQRSVQHLHLEIGKTVWAQIKSVALVQ